MEFLKRNKISILFLIIGIMIGLTIMSFGLRQQNVPLSNDEKITTFSNLSITSDEYYHLLKEETGIDLLLEMIDDKLLSDIYELDEKTLKEIKTKMQDTIKFYKEYYDTNEQDFLTKNGFKNKDAFLNFLILDYKRDLYLKDYLKENISNKEINYYYNNKMEKDIEISYFMGDEKALIEILSKLNDGASVDEIKKNYPKVTYKDLGFIAFDNKEIDQDIYNDALNLSENSYTKSLRSINNKYYIIFKGKVKEKESVELLRGRILEKIIEEKISNDSEKALQKEALINLRKTCNITFYDTYLNNLYNTYIKN